MSQNSLLLYQLVDVLKWWYICISVIIPIAVFQAIIVYVLAWCLHAITWRHDVTAWRTQTFFLISACRCARKMIIFLFLWNFGLLSSKLLSVLYLHDDVTSWRHVMTSKTGGTPSQLVDVLARWLFFCFYSILGWQNQKYHWFCICICGYVMPWRYDVMAWLYDVTYLTLSILACGVAREMIPCPCIHGFLDHLIRKCHSISTAMMTSLYAETSWSWRLVTISQVSFHSS